MVRSMGIKNDFIDVVSKKREPIINIAEATKSVELISVIYQSVRKEKGWFSGNRVPLIFKRLRLPAFGLLPSGFLSLSY